MSPSSALATLVATVLAAAGGRAQSTWHVDASAAPGGTGTSWSTAFSSLDAALGAAASGDRVWVAAGTYRPAATKDPADPRSAVFQVSKNLKLYGGFDGTETSLSQRAGLFASTVLSGDLGVPGDVADNAYTVVRFEPVGAGMLVELDGFRVEGAYGTTQRGGGLLVTSKPVNGLYASVLLANVEVRECTAWQGGGAAVDSGSTLRLKWCRLERNRALAGGGGLYVASSRVQAASCVWSGNRAGDGGAVFVRDSNGFFEVLCANSVFRANRASATGGAVRLYAKDINGIAKISARGTFDNCTFALNAALGAGGALRADTDGTAAAGLTVRNSIVYRNTAPQDPEISGPATVAFSDVRGGHPGVGNLSADPRFAAPGLGDLRLLPGSPCVDAGSTAWVVSDALDLDQDLDLSEPVPLELGARRRLRDDPQAPDTGVGPAPVVDMGCHEL